MRINPFLNLCLFTVLCMFPQLTEATLLEKAFLKLSNQVPDATDCFDFVVLGDTRSGQPVVLPEVFKQIIREINSLKPSFVMACGDLILGGAAEGLEPQWAEFERVVSNCEVPFFPVTGNHDISDETSEAIWKRHLGSTRYTFRYGNSLFIALNSEEVGALDRLSDDQVAWVAGLLDKTTAEHVFLFMHKPYFAMDWEKNWSNIAEVFRGRPVRVVFGSDIHVYRDCGVREGVRYVITGGGGAPIRASEEEGGFHHYILVHVRGKQVTWSVIRPGSVLPETIVTQDRVDEIRNIREKWVRTEPLEVPLGDSFNRDVRLYFSNPYSTSFETDIEWKVPSGWTVSPTKTTLQVLSNATSTSVFKVRAESPESVRFPVPHFHTRFLGTLYGDPVDIEKRMDLIPTVTARHVSRAITLDGDLGDWGPASSIPLWYAHGFDPQNTEDLQAWIRLLWDEDHLYLAVEARDDEFYQPYAGDIVWLADNVELFIGDWSWGLSLTSKGPEVFLYWGIDRSRETVNTEVRLAVNRIGNRTIYEAAFPKRVLTPLELKKGESFLFSLLVNDLDSKVPDRPRHWLELTPGAGSGKKGFPRAKIILDN